LAEAVVQNITGQHKRQGLNLDLNLSEEWNDYLYSAKIRVWRDLVFS
jgi:hypothetical protein